VFLSPGALTLAPSRCRPARERLNHRYRPDSTRTTSPGLCRTRHQGSGTGWQRAGTRPRTVVDRSDRRADSPVAGHTSDVASQPPVRIPSERRTRPDPRGADHPGAPRPPVTPRIDSLETRQGPGPVV
jgi:hypothetical protein